jgi:hypothetical protein
MTEKTFPEINFQRLVSEAIRWVRRFPSIKQITFFPHKGGGPCDQHKKYLVDICMDDGAPTYQIEDIDSDCLQIEASAFSKSFFYESLEDAITTGFDPNHWELWARLESDPLPRPFLGDTSKAKILYQPRREIGFSELDIEYLKGVASRWVADHKRNDLGEKPLNISRILLFHCATPFQRYYDGTVPTKYAVVFELPYERTHEDDYEIDDPLERFICETQYFGTTEQKSSLFYGDFPAVYNVPPGEDFYREWSLVPLYRGMEAPLQVRVDEGEIILYDEKKQKGKGQDREVFDKYVRLANEFMSKRINETGQAPLKSELEDRLQALLRKNNEALGKRAALPDATFRQIWKTIPKGYKRDIGEKTRLSLK